MAVAMVYESKPPPLVLEQEDVVERSTTIVGVVKGTARGELAQLLVELRRGRGRVLLSVPPYEERETQNSAVEAVKAAEEVTGFDLSGVDVVFSIRADLELIAGPSAGAAMALLVVAAIENLKVRTDAVVSALVEPDGGLKPAGLIDIKLQAAEEAGFKLFVVARGQGGLEVPSGIRVVEVGTLGELCETLLF